MKFSIVINNYNYASYLPNAIESVLNQTYQNFELIIVDDASRDGSSAIIEAYAQTNAYIIPVLLQTNSGQAHALNEGVAKADGDIICFLDSDDWFYPKKLETLKRYFETTNALYIHHNHTTMHNECEVSDALKHFPYEGHSSFLIYYLSHYVGNICSTLSIRKEVANKIFPLPFCDQWRIQADDLIVFQAAMFYKALFIHEPLTYYRIHNCNGYFGKVLSSSAKYQLLQKRNRVKDFTCKRLELPQLFFKNTYNLLAEWNTYTYVDWKLAKLYLRILWYEMSTPFCAKIISSYYILKSLYKGLL